MQSFEEFAQHMAIVKGIRPSVDAATDWGADGVKTAEIFRYALENIDSFRAVNRVGVLLDGKACELLGPLEAIGFQRGWTPEEAVLEVVVREFHRRYNA